MTEDLNIQNRRGRFYIVLEPEDQLLGYLIVTKDHPTLILIKRGTRCESMGALFF